MFTTTEEWRHLSVGVRIFNSGFDFRSGIPLEVSPDSARLELQLPLIGAHSAWVQRYVEVESDLCEFNLVDMQWVPWLIL